MCTHYTLPNCLLAGLDLNCWCVLLSFSSPWYPSTCGTGHELPFLFNSFWDRISHTTGWPQTLYVTEDDRGLLMHPPPPPTCWDCKCALPCPVYDMLGMNTRSYAARQALCQLSCLLVQGFELPRILCVRPFTASSLPIPCAQNLSVLWVNSILLFLWDDSLTPWVSDLVHQTVLQDANHIPKLWPMCLTHWL